MYWLDVLPSEVDINRVIVDLRILGRQPLPVETTPCILSDESAPTDPSLATLEFLYICVELLALCVPSVGYNGGRTHQELRTFWSKRHIVRYPID